jgi:hypothetical protein
MKKRILFLGIAIALTCLALTSCDWFMKKKTIQQPILIGKWVLVSMTDSSKKSGDGTNLMVSDTSKKTSPVVIEFKPDSSLTISQDSSFHGLIGTGKFSIASTLLTVFFQEDSLTLPLTIKQQTDSSMQLFSTEDSVSYILQKIK